MLHLQWLRLAFDDLFHVVHVFHNLFQVAFLVVFLIVTIAQPVFVILFPFEFEVVVKRFPVAISATLRVVPVEHFAGVEETFLVGDDFN